MRVSMNLNFKSTCKTTRVCACDPRLLKARVKPRVYVPVILDCKKHVLKHRVITTLDLMLGGPSVTC